ncbi:MAG: sulfatase-like hydrolase/transferase, partial [Rhodothermales bacterium]|nr:sulfatase-like hydrolase/transferase [Rhodothermales bacterium]
GEIRRTDEFIADLLASLEDLGLSENSLFVLLSDHGEGFWEHGHFEHGNTLYNELLNVPLILWSPDRLPSGKTIPDVVQTTDILPTILDFAGIPARPTIRGTSLLPVISGQAPSNPYAYSEFAHSGIIEGKAIQSRSFKYIGPNERRQTAQHYDLTRDPAEMNDLGAAGHERAIELLAAMKQIVESAELSRGTVTRPVQEVSEETLQKLKALGYID